MFVPWDFTFVQGQRGWHSNLTKIPLTCSVSYFNLGWLGALFGRISPPKPPVATELYCKAFEESADWALFFDYLGVGNMSDGLFCCSIIEGVSFPLPSEKCELSSLGLELSGHGFYENFNLIYLFVNVNRHEIHSMSTHTLHKAGR